MRNSNIFVGNIVFLILINFSLNTQVHFQFPFQKKIWSYWHQEIQAAPFFVRGCYHKLKMQSEQAGFQFTVVNKKTVKNYVEDYEQNFIKVRLNSFQKGIQFDADLLRFLLIQQHGGVWVDITSVFINGLTQLQNIMDPQYHHLITNKFSSIPQVILPYFSLYQNRLQQKIKIIKLEKISQQILFNEFPGYEIYFIGGKKNCQLIKTLRRTYSQFCQLSYEQMMNIFISEDIFMNNLDHSNYLTGDMSIIYILQKKQKQLDKNLSIFGNRQMSFQYYKLWSFQAVLGPLFMHRFQIKQTDLFTLSQEDLNNKGIHMFLQIKFVGTQREFINDKIQLSKNVFSKSINNFETFLLSNPQTSLCQNINFIVQNSIMANIFQNTSILQSQNIPVITKQQHDRWNHYCQQIQSEEASIFQFLIKKLNKILLKAFPFDNRSKVNWIIQNQQNYNLIQTLSIWLKDNIFFIKISIVVILGTFFIIFIDKMFYHLYFYSYNFGFNEQQQKYYSLNQNQNQPQYLSQINIQDFFFQKLQICLKSKGFNRVGALQLQLLFILNLIMYLFTDVLSGRNQPWSIFWSTIITYFVLNLVQSETLVKKSQKIVVNTISSQTKQEIPQRLTKLHLNEFVYLNYLYQQFFLLINFFSVYLLLKQLMHHQVGITYHSIVIGFVWPSLFKIIESLTPEIKLKNKQKHSEKQFQQHMITFLIENLLRNIKSLVNRSYHRWFVIFCFGTINLFPNIKYIPFNHSYFLTNLISNTTTIITVVLFIILVVQLVYKKKLFDILRIFLLGTLVFINWNARNTEDGIVSIVQRYRILFILRTYFYILCINVQIGTQINKKPNQQNLSHKVYFSIQLLKYFAVPLVFLLLEHTHVLTYFGYQIQTDSSLFAQKILKTVILLLTTCNYFCLIFRQNILEKVIQKVRYIQQKNDYFTATSLLEQLKEIKQKQKQ